MQVHVQYSFIIIFPLVLLLSLWRNAFILSVSVSNIVIYHLCCSECKEDELPFVCLCVSECSFEHWENKNSIFFLHKNEGNKIWQWKFVIYLLFTLAFGSVRYKNTDCVRTMRIQWTQYCMAHKHTSHYRCVSISCRTVFAPHFPI